jgi:dephospho-CoA kinase
MIIGITGTIGSGKTAVSEIFAKKGFVCINADKLYHSLAKPNKKIYNKIVAEFGKQILNDDKTINRSILKKIVFNDTFKLKKLNSITHPMIVSQLKKEILKLKGKKIVVDAPLLIEANAAHLADKIILVKAPEKMRLNRLLKKGYSKKEIISISNSQLPLKEKSKHSDFVIENSKGKKHLEKQVLYFIVNFVDRAS